MVSATDNIKATQFLNEFNLFQKPVIRIKPFMPILAALIPVFVSNKYSKLIKSVSFLSHFLSRFSSELIKKTTKFNSASSYFSKAVLKSSSDIKLLFLSFFLIRLKIASAILYCSFDSILNNFRLISAQKGCNPVRFYLQTNIDKILKNANILKLNTHDRAMDGAMSVQKSIVSEKHKALIINTHERAMSVQKTQEFALTFFSIQGIGIVTEFEENLSNQSTLMSAGGFMPPVPSKILK